MDVKYLERIFSKASFHIQNSPIVFTVKDGIIKACTAAQANDRVVSIEAEFPADDIVFGIRAGEVLKEIKKLNGEVSLLFGPSSLTVTAMGGRKKSVEIPIIMDVERVAYVSDLDPRMDKNVVKLGVQSVPLEAKFTPDIKIMATVFKDAMNVEEGGTLSSTDGLVEWSVDNKIKVRDEIVAEDVSGNAKSIYTGLDELAKVIDGPTEVHFGTKQVVVFEEYSEGIHATYLVMPRMEY